MSLPLSVVVTHSEHGQMPVRGSSGTVGRPCPITPGTRNLSALGSRSVVQAPSGGEGVDGGKFSSDRRRPLGENSNKTLPFLGVNV